MFRFVIKHPSLILIAIVFCWLSFITKAHASVNIPSFDSCHNPTGAVKVDYPQGLHAIVGVTGLQSGSDKVFSGGNEDYTQCFCPLSGNTGIKTQWLSAGDISKEDQNVLITQGWFYIENGADWGLSPQAYLAKNIEFSCGGGGGTQGGGGGTSSGSNGGGGGTTSGSGGTGGGGDVLGISTLAATSNPITKYQILLTILLAAGLISYGYKIQKNQS